MNEPIINTIDLLTGVSGYTPSWPLAFFLGVGFTAIILGIVFCLIHLWKFILNLLEKMIEGKIEMHEYECKNYKYRGKSK